MVAGRARDAVQLAAVAEEKEALEAALEEAKQQVRPALRVDRLAEWRC